MKKIILIMLTVFLNMAMLSCSPQSNTDIENPQQTAEDCCGDGSTIPPPPPPPGG